MLWLLLHNVIASRPLNILLFLPVPPAIVFTGKQHSSDFSRLIAQVRGRLETTRQTRVIREVVVDKEDAQNTHAAGTLFVSDE